MTQAAPLRPRGGIGAGPARPAAPRLRLAASVLLLVVAMASFAAGCGLLLLRHVLRARDGDDIRPCPACHSPAVLDGRSLTDEQGQRLLFATPDDAARYAADYARARDRARSDAGDTR